MSYFGGRIVVISGASSGIGAALSIHLASRGAKLALVARRSQLLSEVAEKCLQAGGSLPLILSADVTSEEEMGRVREQVLEGLGTPDIVIANAGLGIAQTARRMDTGTIRRTMEVNVIGVSNLLVPFIKDMLERGSGQLVAVSSLAGLRGLPTSAAYCASKSAVTTFMEGLRVDLRGTGVTSTVIQPGFVATPMTAPNRFKMPFLLTPDQAAGHVMKALERRCSRYAFPWQMGLAMRFLRGLPDWLYDRLMSRASGKPRKKESPAA